MQINIAAKTEELIVDLRKDLPVIKECADMWNKNYAVFCGVVPPLASYLNIETGRWTDEPIESETAMFWRKFESFVRDWFKEDDSVTVKIYSGAQEVEIYRPAAFH
jgi:acetyl esterase/lipase